VEQLVDLQGDCLVGVPTGKKALKIGGVAAVCAPAYIKEISLIFSNMT
jgi:hypothetical protein